MDFPKTMWTFLLADPERARETIARDYRKPVYEYARKMRLPEPDAEDVAQEVLMRVCDRAFLEKADRSKGKFRTLVLAVTKHVIASHRRKELAGKRDQRRNVALGDIDVAAEVEPDPEFDRLWARNLVIRAMERLKKDRHVAALRLQLEGKSYKEIARELGKSEADVTNYVHRAKPKLKAEIEKLIAEYCAPDEVGAEADTVARYL